MAKTRPKVDDWLQGEKRTLLVGWCRRGLSNQEIYEHMGISKQTFYTWCDRNNDFLDIIKNEKEIAYVNVENSLFEQAMKGNPTAIIFFLKNRLPKNWKDKIEQEADQTAINVLQDILGGLKMKAKSDANDKPIEETE